MLVDLEDRDDLDERTIREHGSVVALLVYTATLMLLIKERAKIRDLKRATGGPLG